MMMETIIMGKQISYNMSHYLKIHKTAPANAINQVQALAANGE